MEETKNKNKRSSRQAGAQVPVALMIILSAVFGFMGGWFATENLSDRSSDASQSFGQQIVSSEGEAIARTAEIVGPSVASVNVKLTTTRTGIFGPQTFESEGAGTGIILNKDGLIVTNKHVVGETATEVSLVLSDGTIVDDVEVIARDQFTDIAFLRVKNPENLVPATLGDSSVVRVGQRAIAIGNALGQFENTVTAGIISGIGRPIVASSGADSEQLQNLFQTDTAINPGNSGGPLVNISGEVIGINTAVAGNAENIGFAIPINDVKPLIESIETNGELIRPYLGVRYVSLTNDLANELDLSVTRGAYVTAGGQPAILPDSPAEKAGIRGKDVITRVGDTGIDERNPLVSLLSRYKVGESVPLTVVRDGSELTIEVTLEAAPSD